MVDLDFCFTYLKNTKFDLVTYLTNNQNILLYPVKCCSNYINIVVIQYTLVVLVYFGSSTIPKIVLLNAVW